MKKYYKGKRLTIYDLLPLLKKGWVACDYWGDWVWFEKQPKIECKIWHSMDEYVVLSASFNIKPYEDYWKCSLIEVGGNK